MRLVMLILITIMLIIWWHCSPSKAGQWCAHGSQWGIRQGRDGGTHTQRHRLPSIVKSIIFYWGGWWGNSWLPYSTDFLFVFVSWVGGGNPPWAVPKSLRPHCDQEKQAGDNFFAKYPCHAYKYESHAKKTAPKKVKNLLKTAVSSDWQSHPGNGEQACSLPHTDFSEFHISH